MQQKLLSIICEGTHHFVFQQPIHQITLLLAFFFAFVFFESWTKSPNKFSATGDLEKSHIQRSNSCKFRQLHLNDNSNNLKTKNIGLHLILSKLSGCAATSKTPHSALTFSTNWWLPIGGRKLAAEVCSYSYSRRLSFVDSRYM